MQNNLGQSVKKQLLVDSEGPYKTIQEAIDDAEPGTCIKVTPGLYPDNLIIRKPGLKIEPKEKQGDIILVVQSRPAITIDLKKGEKCSIIGLKMSHSGHNEDEEKNNNALYMFGNQQNTPSQFTPENELINRFPIDNEMNCIVLLLGGTLFLDDDLLSLNFIVKAHKNIIPALVVNEGTDIVVNRCEIKGNKNHDTVGILVNKPSLAVIKDSKIHNHKMGGILVWGSEEHNIKIMNSRILFNDKCGIHCVGEDNTCYIESNKIENNFGPGVKIGIANKAKIIKNDIKLNQIGIEVTSGEPYIYSNKIEKNYTDGILSKCHENLRCDAKIKQNDISGNKENGIHCTGAKNFTRIELNQFIGYNKKAGVKIDNYAEVSIYKNVICKNLAQGVLLVETSQAVIEKNQIHENIKSNIAYGGQNSVNTFIVENNIFGGRCEGIFVIEGGQSLILRNTIYENNDGIVSLTSVPIIWNNKITKNKSNGIMILKDSRPQILLNYIHENDGIGLYIRDKSQGKVKKNDIKQNEIELVIEKKMPKLANILKKNNVEGDIRIPQNFECNIF